MYRNALVTTDGSATAASVLAHVVQVVAPDGAVTVVEVIDDVARILAKTTPAGFEFGGGSVGVQIAEEAVAAQRGEAEGHLAAAKAQLESAGIKNVKTLILSGLPGEAITDTARSQKVDVLLMATHGRSGLRRAVLGSVAEHVVRHLEGVPIILVNPKG